SLERRATVTRSAAQHLRYHLAACSADARHAAPDRQARADPHEAIGVFDQHVEGSGRRRRSAGVGARAPADCRSGARCVRARTGNSSRTARARKRAARPSPRQRHRRNANGHGGSRGRQYRGGAERKSTDHAGSCVTTKPLKSTGHVASIMRALARAIDGMELPAVEKIAESQQEDPFQVLIGTLLSARTQDATTLAASTRLFKVARTPAPMAKLTVRRIERLIYPVSFYRHKARHVKATCQRLVNVYGGR